MGASIASTCSCIASTCSCMRPGSNWRAQVLVGSGPGGTRFAFDHVRVGSGLGGMRLPSGNKVDKSVDL